MKKVKVKEKRKMKTAKQNKTATRKNPLVEAVEQAKHSIACGGPVDEDMTSAMRAALHSHKKKSVEERLKPLVSMGLVKEKRMKKKKDELVSNAAFVIPNNHKFWSLTVDYEYTRDCDTDPEVCRNDYCRCGRVTSTPEIANSSHNRHGFALECMNILKGDMVSSSDLTLDDVIAYRVFAASFDNEAFTADVMGGYYGEEVGQARISSITKKLEGGIDVINSTLSPVEKLNAALNVEYQWSTLKFNECKLITINADDFELVEYSSQKPKSKTFESSVKHTEAFKNYDAIAHLGAFHAGNAAALVPIVTKAPGGKYVIVDGNHRWAAVRHAFQAIEVHKQAFSGYEGFKKAFKKIYLIEVS